MISCRLVCESAYMGSPACTRTVHGPMGWMRLISTPVVEVESLAMAKKPGDTGRIAIMIAVITALGTIGAATGPALVKEVFRREPSQRSVPKGSGQVASEGSVTDKANPASSDERYCVIADAESTFPGGVLGCFDNLKHCDENAPSLSASLARAHGGGNPRAECVEESGDLGCRNWNNAGDPMTSCYASMEDCESQWRAGCYRKSGKLMPLWKQYQ